MRLSRSGVPITVRNADDLVAIWNAGIVAHHARVPSCWIADRWGYV